MWIRKSPRELAAALRAGRLTATLGAACFAVLLGGSLLPYSSYTLPILIRLMAGIGAFLIVMAWRRQRYWRRLQASVWVCEDCNAIRADKALAPCLCGGALRPLHEMKWLEFPPVPKRSVAVASTKKDLLSVPAVAAS